MNNKTSTHYVIVFDFALESTEEESVTTGIEISGVAHSIEEAKTKLAKASEGERKHAKVVGWRILHESETEFCACEDGNYDREHAHFYIAEVSEPVEEVDKTAICSDLLDYIAEHCNDPEDFLYAIMREADLSDEVALAFLSDSFGYKYDEDELKEIVAAYHEQND